MNHARQLPQNPSRRTGTSASVGTLLGSRGGSTPLRRRITLVLAVSLSLVAGAVLIASPALAKQIHYSQGTVGAGELTQPNGLAVDGSSGDLYVTDVATGNVRKFDSSGSPSNFSALGSNTLGPFSFAAIPGKLAVDNSASGTKGNLYVVVGGNGGAVEAFKPSGQKANFSTSASYISGNRITGTPNGAFGFPYAVAIDANGAIYVSDLLSNPHAIDIYAPSGEYLTQLSLSDLFVPSFAVDAAGNLYAAAAGEVKKFIPTSFPVSASTAYGPPTTLFSGPVLDASSTAIAVNAASHLYVLDREANGSSRIVELDEAGDQISESANLGGERLDEPQALAVGGSGASERLYTTQRGSSSPDRRVEAFGRLVTVPDATTGEASEIANTTAKVSGIVNPDETEASYHFEYGLTASYGNEAPVSPTPVGSDKADHPESLELTGLEPSTTYHFRIDGINECEAGAECVSPGDDEIFRTSGPPTLDGAKVTTIAGAIATIKSEINPSGYETEFEVEYGTTEAYGSHGSTGTIGARDELQILRVTGVHEGQYKLSFAGETTGDLAFDAPDSTVEAALRSLPAIGPSGVSVHNEPDTPSGLEYEIAFEGSLAKTDVPPLRVKPGSTSLGNGVVSTVTRIPGGLNSDQSVSAVLTGLQPETTYHFRVVATNHCNSAEPAEICPAQGEGDRTFTTAPPLLIDSTSFSGVTATEATLEAQINPEGTDTTYSFEYGTTESYGFQTAPTDIGSSTADQKASAQLTGLLPGTQYHFRVVATNAFTPASGIFGPDRTFFTYSMPPDDTCTNQLLREENTSLLLPDCRAYEQVSPTSSAEAFMPFSSAGEEGGLANSPSLMQAAADGEAVSYVSEPPSSGVGEGTGNSGSGLGDEHIATRGQFGWASRDIQPLGSDFNTAYQALSSDLSIGILAAGSARALASGIEAKCTILYSRLAASSSYQPLYTSELAGECNSNQPPFFVGASTDFSHLYFESRAALTSGSKKASEGLGHENIYGSFGGELFQVNILPGSKPKGNSNATAGALAAEGPLETIGSFPPINASNVVSADGSRVFWTNLVTGIVYVRENGSQEPSAVGPQGECTEAALACTVQLSAGAATYETATPDGHYAYYTEAGQLWRFDLLGYREALQEGEPQAQALALAREALTEPGAAVQGVIGVNEVGESGSYLYFVAAGKLTPDAEARKCEAADKEGTPQESGEADEEFEGKAPPGRGCNLYLLHAGTATLVATLSPGDNYLLGAGVEEHQAGEAHPAKGVWRPVLGYRAAQLSPDGHHLVFMSQRRLTAYDNLSTDGGCNFATLRAACAEVYLYDAGSAEISCASCAPTGIPPLKQSGPSSGAHGIERGARTFLPGDFGLGALTHMRRLLSADGDRVFFDTDQPLASADTNGHQDVYEWERAGRGTCVQGSPLNGGGCVYLLSGGTGPENAYLIDVSASGSDAFLVTRSPLVPTDSDDKPDLYDVREGGGFPLPVAPVICGGRETCRGPAPSPPALKAPATATFDASESPPKCRRGFVKKRGRCIKRHRHAKKRHHNQAGHDRGGSK